MSAAYSDVRRWEAGALGQAGDCILAGVPRLERAAEAMGEQTFPSGWEGRGATADEHDYGFPTPDDGIGLPSQEVKDEWAAMTVAEREEVLRKMAVELAERYGMPVYSITFGPLGPAVDQAMVTIEVDVVLTHGDPRAVSAFFVKMAWQAIGRSCH